MDIITEAPARAAGGADLDAWLRYATWLSPAFPVGGFSYSHALEYAVDSGWVTDRATLVDWIEGVLEFGTGQTDAYFFATGHADAAAWRATRELALESTNQGEAFLTAVHAVWPHEDLAPRPLPYAVAVGMAARVLGLPLAPALALYLQAFAANLVSAGVRLIPLGQTDGLKALAALEPAFLRPPPERPGGAAVIVDLASMRHETQYTRLFRT